MVWVSCAWRKHTLAGLPLQCAPYSKKRGAKFAPSLSDTSPQSLLGALYLHQRLVRRHAVALLHVHADDDAADRRLDLVLHLHGLDNQHAVTRLDGIADLRFDIDD